MKRLDMVIETGENIVGMGIRTYEDCTYMGEIERVDRTGGRVFLKGGGSILEYAWGLYEVINPLKR